MMESAMTTAQKATVQQKATMIKDCRENLLPKIRDLSRQWPPLNWNNQVIVNIRNGVNNGWFTFEEIGSSEEELQRLKVGDGTW